MRGKIDGECDTSSGGSFLRGYAWARGKTEASDLDRLPGALGWLKPDPAEPAAPQRDPETRRRRLRPNISIRSNTGEPVGLDIKEYFYE
jgi:hypothetical protein